MRCEAKNIFLWGSFTQHCRKAHEGKNKVFHITMAAAEFLPVVSQIVSLIEYLLKSHNNSSKNSKLSFKVTTNAKNSKVSQKSAKTLGTTKNSAAGSTNTTSSSQSSKVSLRTVSSSSSSTSRSSTSVSSTSSSAAASSSSSSNKLTAVILGTKTPSSNLLAKTLYTPFYDFDDVGDNTLVNLIKANDIKEVEKALSPISEDRVNQRIDGKSLLEWAAHYGHKDMVRFLVESGAKNALARQILHSNPRFSNLDNPTQSALLIALLQGHIEIGEYLLDNGAANIDSCTNYNAEYPASIVRLGNLEVFKLVISYEKNPTALHLRKTLHLAKKLDKKEIVDFLISQGVPSS